MEHFKPAFNRSQKAALGKAYVKESLAFLKKAKMHLVGINEKEDLLQIDSAERNDLADALDALESLLKAITANRHPINGDFETCDSCLPEESSPTI